MSSTHQPFHSPAPREYKVSAYNLDEIVPVESDRESFANSVSVFPSANPAKLLEKQRGEFGTYVDYLVEPHTTPAPSR